jgi:hypothetical protein
MLNKYDSKELSDLGLSGLGQDSSINLSLPNWGGDTTGGIQGGTSLISQILAGAANTGFSILKDVYGGAQPGTYIQTPQGMVYRMPEGSPAATITSLPGLSSSGGTGTLLFWGAIGLVAVIAVAKGLGK